MSQRFSGSSLVVEFRGVDLSADVTLLALHEEMTLTEASAAGAPTTTYMPGRITPTVELHVYRLTDGMDAGTLLYAGAQGTLTFGGQGSAVGQPKWSAPVIVQRTRQPFTFADTVLMEVACRLTGDWLANYNRNGDTF